MTRHEALTALLAKVEAGEWDSLSALKIWPQGRVVDGEWVHEYSSALRSFEGSLDSAKALHEAVLPDSDAAIYLSGHAWVYVPTLNAPPVKEYRVENDCPSRAWLIAILKALIAMEEVQ